MYHLSIVFLCAMRSLRCVLSPSKTRKHVARSICSGLKRFPNTNVTLFCHTGTCFCLVAETYFVVETMLPVCEKLRNMFPIQILEICFARALFYFHCNVLVSKAVKTKKLVSRNIGNERMSFPNVSHICDTDCNKHCLQEAKYAPATRQKHPVLSHAMETCFLFCVGLAFTACLRYCPVPCAQ